MLRECSEIIDCLGLNPYSTGSWVAGLEKSKMEVVVSEGLNPYSTGSWVAGRLIYNHYLINHSVLILILLEVGLLEDCKIQSNLTK